MAHINFKSVSRTDSSEDSGNPKITMNLIATVEILGLTFPVTVCYEDGSVFYDDEYVRKQLRDAKLTAMFRPTLREWMKKQV